MKNLIFFILICCSLSMKLLLKDPVKLPNTDFLFKGYNIFMSNLTPKDGDIDPGFEAPIFASSFNDQKITSDNRFEVPDGYFLTRIEGCSIGMTSTLITGENSYQNTFGAELGVTGTIKGIKFSASVSYQNINEETTKNNKVFIYSKSDCKLYSGEMDPMDPPKFHHSFLKGVSIISKNKKTFEEDPEIYWRFIDNFGTHHIYEVKMGARFGAISKTTSKEVEKLTSNTVGFERSIGFKDLFEVNNKITNENKHTSNSLTKMEEVKMFSIGSRPSEKADDLSWSQKAIEEPMPISYKVRPLIDVFSNKIIAFDMKQFKGINVPFVRENLKKAFDNYCEKYLLVNKMVRSCNDVGKDININKIKFDKIERNNFYKLENLETGKCMSSLDLGQTIVSTTCGKLLPKDQTYYLEFTNGYYKLGQRNSICLNVENYNTNEDGKIQTWNCLSNSNQQFTLIENSDGSYTIKTFNEKCLNVKDDNIADDAHIVQSTCNNTQGQRWRAIRVTDTYGLGVNDYGESMLNIKKKLPVKKTK